MREIAKYVHLTRIAGYSVSCDSSHRFAFSDGMGLQFCILCLVPIMIGLKISNEIRFSAFINGKDSSPVIEILGSYDIGKSICSQLQGYNESYTEIKADKPVKIVKLEDKYYLAFDSLFSPTRLKLKDPFVNRLEDICIFVTIYELFRRA